MLPKSTVAPEGNVQRCRVELYFARGNARG